MRDDDARGASRARCSTPTATSCSPRRATAAPPMLSTRGGARSLRSALHSQRLRAPRRSDSLSTTRDGRHGPLLRRANSARRAGARARAPGAARARHPPLRQRRGSIFAWTAPSGRYDAYFERTVKQWDIAAGALICERAGLSVLERCPCARGSAVGHPRRAARALASRNACSSSSGSVKRVRRRQPGGARGDRGARLIEVEGRRLLFASRCGGWESNPHALSDRAFLRAPRLPFRHRRSLLPALRVATLTSLALRGRSGRLRGRRRRTGLAARRGVRGARAPRSSPGWKPRIVKAITSICIRGTSSSVSTPITEALR